ncbi:MAG: hypothetical protein ACXADY_20690 [Candidatus Hodarchaeales archaeon]|jgi:hypothetical protein
MSGTVTSKEVMGETTGKEQLQVENIRLQRLEILRHNRHKILSGQDYKHFELPSPLKEADMIAARMAREKAVERKIYTEIDNRLRIAHATCCPVVTKLPAAERMLKLFEHDDPAVIHGKVLQSRELACYNESKTFPFTSLKHHVLLATALVENFREMGSCQLRGLVLCVSWKPPENLYKLVGFARAKKRGQWTTVYLYLDNDYTGKGNANATYSFKNTWNNMYGFRKEKVLLGMNVAMMNSWTAALVTLEEAGKTCKI